MRETAMRAAQDPTHQNVSIQKKMMQEIETQENEDYVFFHISSE